MMEEVFQRTQFTFYESFYKSIEKNLKKKSDRLAAFEYLCHYALYGKKPENENISDCVEGLMMAFIPFLDTARRNAKNAAYPRPGANAAKEEQENKNKNKNEYKNEYKTEPEIKRPAEEFEKFWQAYPKKVGRREAEKAFQHVLAPLETLLQALE